MYRLDRQEYENVKPLFAELARYHLHIISIIEGHSDGEIFVDHKKNPKSAFIWTSGGDADSYLAGFEHNKAFNHKINNMLLGKLIQPPGEKSDCITVYWHPASWEDEFKTIFKGINPIRSYRRHLLFRQFNFNWQERMSEGFRIQTVTDAFMRTTDLRNSEDLKAWLNYPDMERNPFMSENGRGLCMIDDNKNTCVSWCQIDYVSVDRAEIGVRTAEEYRNQGFASLIIAATVDFLLARGIQEIGWHYWRANIASGRAAERVGFEQTIEHPVYFAIFHRFDNLLFQARKYATELRDLHKCAAAFEEAFKLAETDYHSCLSSPHLQDTGEKNLSKYYYDYACVLALLEEKTHAIDMLHKALDEGFDDFERLAKDKDLEHLHHLEEWGKLIDQLGQR